MSEDRSLVRQLNLGSKQALRRIYEKYREDLFTIAVALTGNSHVAEDCLQDVFVRLAESAGRIQVRHNLKGYLASAVVNKARDRLRRTSRQVDCPVEAWPLEETGPGPEQQAICDEQTAAILKALARLPAEQREVFVLYSQGAMSFRQLANERKISIRTAHSRYRYALGKLRQLLREVEP